MPTERKNISQPSDHWQAFQTAADLDGLSLSEWMSEKCRAALPVKVQKTLGQRREAHRPKNLSTKPE
jgi:hypothetical protein